MLKCSFCALVVLMKYPGGGALIIRGFPLAATYSGITTSLAWRCSGLALKVSMASTFFLSRGDALKTGPANLWSPRMGHMSPSARCTLIWCLNPAVGGKYNHSTYNYYTTTSLSKLHSEHDIVIIPFILKIQEYICFKNNGGWDGYSISYVIFRNHCVIVLTDQSGREHLHILWSIFGITMHATNINTVRNYW